MEDAFTFIVLAGRPETRDELLEEVNLDNKVFIKYNGKTLFEIVFSAINETELVSNILIVGINEDEVDIPDGSPPTYFLNIQGEQYDKIFKATEYVLNHPQIFDDPEHIIYTSADQPLLTSTAVKNFINLCGILEYELYYPIVPSENALEQLPEYPWNFMKIKSGKYVSGNFAIIDPRRIIEKYNLVKFLSENRKKFVWGVLKTSPWMFLKLIFGRISLHEAEKLMTSYFGVNSKLVVTEDIEISIDIDKSKHLDYFDIRK